MDWGLMGAIYAMMHATHGIADYWLQTDWMAQNKSKDWEALRMHVVIYSFSFMPIAWMLVFAGHLPVWKTVALPFVIGIPHAWMDRRRFLAWFLHKTKGWSPEPNLGQPATHLAAQIIAVRTHVTIHMDQKFHYACLCLTAMWLAYGGTS